MTALRHPLRRLQRWTGSLFGSGRLEDESAEREEFGVADRGRTELERDKFSTFQTGEAASAALDELDELKPPPP